MAFGMPTSGGSSEITPYIKYNAKAGRLIRVDRVQTSTGWESDEEDITSSFQAVIDLENILVGWLYYSPQGPQKAMGIYKKEPTPERPSDVDDKGKSVYKSGFYVRMALSKACGGGIREFGSNASCVVEALGALHDAYEMTREAQSGQLPVVKMSGTTTEKGQFGTNYRPNFEIVSWVDRPEALAAPVAKAPAPSAQKREPFAGSAPSTGSTTMEPPQTQAAKQPEPATADANDFG